MRFWTPKKVHGNPLVGIAVAAFLETRRDEYCLNGLVASFQAQTYENWRLLVVHDGPLPAGPTQGRLAVLTGADARVELVLARERKKQFGHPHRQAAVDTLLKSGCAWVGMTNQDNWYAPTYLEWMLSVGTHPKRPKDFVYCDCLHSHKLWRQMITEPRRGKLDLGGWLARAELIKQVQFTDYSFDGDGKYIDKLRTRARGKIEKVPGTLFVHN